MLEVQKRLLENPSIDDLCRDFRLVAKRYENSVVLNYGPAPKNSEIVNECRALHLSLPDFQVISRGFRRFFNYGEPGCDFVLDGQTVVSEKIDGSLVIIYNHNGEWFARSRKTAFAEEKLAGGKVMADYVKQAIREERLDFPSFSPLCSYVFELVCPQNRIVTPYMETSLYFLACFNNKSGRELDYNLAWRQVACEIPCKRPKVFQFSSLKEIMDSAAQLPPLEEGYVAKNSRGQRVKIKNPAYVALHALRTCVNSDEKFLEMIEAGEDSEYLAYFDIDRKRIENIRGKRDKILDKAQKIWDELKNCESRKDFALRANRYPFAVLLFKARDVGDVYQAWNDLRMSAKKNLVFKE